MSLVANYTKKLADYAPLYETHVRNLKRWIATGRAASPPEFPPLDSPHLMALWWSRHMKQRVPPKFAALAAAPPASPSDETPPQAAEDNPPDNSLDLTALDTTASLGKQQARALLAATYEKLRRAYDKGDDNDIRLWQPRWEKAQEAARKAELAEKEIQKAEGETIPRADVIADLLALLESLKVMRSSMDKRVEKRLRPQFPDLPEEFWTAHRLAVIDEREREDEILRSLKTFRAPGEIVFKLEAAA